MRRVISFYGPDPGWPYANIHHGSLREETWHILQLNSPMLVKALPRPGEVEWHVKVGDVVREDDLLAAVMTDKAAVEIPSSRGDEGHRRQW